ncbi:BON domain-containing protein [Thiocapsa sp.]|uniref:BON domain-containing protein n=1 Tax=Thiocapsa sp. TaxID=2024551 RepID=UPI0025E738C0|nr:BON domain-containing protein [Thiocapsa sp.]
MTSDGLTVRFASLIVAAALSSGSGATWGLDPSEQPAREGSPSAPQMALGGLNGAAEAEGNTSTEVAFYRWIDQADTGTRIKLRLLWSKTTNSRTIHVDVGDERVLLTGVVRTWREKEVAHRTASRMAGVVGVDNRLDVDPDASRVDQGDPLPDKSDPGVFDSWITTRITASLSFDRTIDHALIRVASRSGIATLKGQVPTSIQKREAGLIAADTAGVERVENELVVAPRM